MRVWILGKGRVLTWNSSHPHNGSNSSCSFLWMSCSRLPPLMYWKKYQTIYSGKKQGFNFWKQELQPSSLITALILKQLKIGVIINEKTWISGNRRVLFFKHNQKTNRNNFHQMCNRLTLFFITQVFFNVAKQPSFLPAEVSYRVSEFLWPILL